MGTQNSTKIIIICTMFIFLLISNLNAPIISKIIDEEKISNFFENLPIKFGNLNDVWTLKNNLDDLTLKNSINIEYVPGEIIVKFNNEVPKYSSFFFTDSLTTGVASLDSINSRYGLLDVEKISKKAASPVLENVYKFKFPVDSDVSTIIEFYDKEKTVDYVEPNYLFRLLNTPEDTYFSLQWALNQTNDCDIDAPEAWDVETGDESIVVAIIDTGVDYNHSDLSDNIWNNTAETVNEIDDDSNGYIDDIRGWDFYYKDNDPIDDYGHGTHCAGIVAGVTNNSIGMAGITWNCTIMPIKIGGAYGIPLDAAANGITYAADNGANVISMSWGGYFTSTLISDAVDYAYGKGSVLVGAAGNSYTDMKLYPAAYTKVIAVAATNGSDAKASFSNYGDWIDIAAPGVDIFSTMPTYPVFMNTYYGYSQNYDNCSGTSMACPYVAGLAGLLLSKNSSYNTEEVRSIIKSSTDTVTSEYYIGSGRINAYSAIIRDSVPLAIINSSLADSSLTGNVTITGTANGSLFTNYSIYYGLGLYPTSWTEILNSSLKVNDSILAYWNTTLVDDGTYVLRLVVNDSNGLFGEDRLKVEVNNVVNTFYVGGTGPDNYSYIQDAIDDADDGDTIFVYNGTYYESLMISDNINLVGENKTNTIIDGTYDYYCGWVDAGQCNIENFSILNGGYGLIYTSSSNSIIQNNNINNNLYGIYLISNVGEYSYNMSNISGGNLFSNRIENNSFNNNYYGIILQGDLTLACNNIIMGDSGLYGVLCWGNNNTIENNNISNQQYYSSGYGIYLYPGSLNNILRGNLINESNTAIYIGDNSNNTAISKNTIKDNGKGIYIYGQGEVDGDIVDTIYMDSFEDGDASDWSIYDIKGSGYTWEVSSYVPYWADLTYINGTYFLMIDDDDAPIEMRNLDSAVTPPINCTSYSDVYLVFSIDFRDFIGYGEFWVNVSTNNGSTWTNVWYETEDNDTEVALNISSIADGEEILVNFTYDDNDEWAWGALIDEIIVGSSYEYSTSYDNGNTSINNNNIFNNTDYGVNYDSTGPSINATLNWWGDETGPYNASSNPDGIGDYVYGSVDFNPWLTHYYPGVKNLNAGQTYTMIQDAINATNDGDTIAVYEGLFYENLIINKSITLQAGSTPIIDGRNGIGLFIEANNTTIKELNFTNCSIGVRIYNNSFEVNNVTIFKNSIYNNTVGILLNDSSDNLVYHNNFFNNTQQAYDNSTNTWYNTTLLNGNYWDNFDESSEGAYDNDSNGIIDSAYNISGGNNQDEYPLSSQFENYYILSIADSQVDEETQFSVIVRTDGGTTIEGATVTFNGNSQDSSSSGQVTFTSPSVSSDTIYQINATKIGCTSDSAYITVNNVESGNGGGGTQNGGNGEGGYPTGPDPPTNIRCTSTEADNTPTFVWNASYDSSGILGYYIKIDEGDEIWIGNVLTWTLTTAIEDGSHTFCIKAQDASINKNNGSYGSYSFLIDSMIIGNSPVADANGPYIGLTNQNITFDGSNSYDNGTIVNYTWNFGDGNISNGIKPVHKYKVQGEYNVILTVTDDDGLSDTNSTTVTILLDTDGDGWSDLDEGKCNTNITNPNDYPVDTDGDRIADEFDDDDDNDGLFDYLEETLQSDPKDASDVIIINITGDENTYYLIDNNKDGICDELFNSNGRVTDVGMTKEGLYLLDIDGDKKWEYTYDPASKEITPYEEKESEDAFPLVFVIIGIIIAIIVIIAVLFLTGFIWIERKE